MGRRRIRAAEVTRRTQPTESAQWGSYGLFTTEEPSMGPARIYSRPSACMLWLLTWCFGGTYNSGSRCVSDSFACCWDSLGCLNQSWYEGFCLVWLYLALSSSVFVSWITIFSFFLKRNEEGVDLVEREGGEELGGVEGGETWDVLCERRICFQ